MSDHVHMPLLRSHQRWADPKIILLLLQHVPDQHSELAGDRHRRDLMATLVRTRKKKALSGPGAFAAAQAASTSMARA